MGGCWEGLEFRKRYVYSEFSRVLIDREERERRVKEREIRLRSSFFRSSFLAHPVRRIFSVYKDLQLRIPKRSTKKNHSRASLPEAAQLDLTLARSIPSNTHPSHPLTPILLLLSARPSPLRWRPRTGTSSAPALSTISFSQRSS